MMKKLLKLAMAVMAIILVSSGLEAQALAFTKRPVTREQYASAIQNNDRRVLNLDCGAIVRSANSIFGHSFTSCGQLATFVGQLTVADCPLGVSVGLGRVLASGRTDINGWRRPFRIDEKCLYDNNTGLWFASLSCGNLVTERLSVRTAMATPEAQPVQPAGPRRPDPTFESEPVRVQVEVDVNDTRQVTEVRRRGHGLGWWLPRLAVLGAAGYAGYMCATDWCSVTQETVVIVNQ